MQANAHSHAHSHMHFPLKFINTIIFINLWNAFLNTLVCVYAYVSYVYINFTSIAIVSPLMAHTCLRAAKRKNIFSCMLMFILLPMPSSSSSSPSTSMDQMKMQTKIKSRPFQCNDLFGTKVAIPCMEMCSMLSFISRCVARSQWMASAIKRTIWNITTRWKVSKF